MRGESADPRRRGEVLNFNRSRLNQFLQLDLASNAHYESRDFLWVLSLCSSVVDASAHSGVRLLKTNSRAEVPSDDRILDTLGSQDPTAVAGQFQRLADEVLTEARRLASPLKDPVIVSIDGNPWRYYGKKVPEIVGTKRDRGTNWAYLLETAIVSDNRFPLVVGAEPVTPFTNRHGVLRRLVILSLERLKVSLFLVDRGYYSVATIRLFQEAGVPFIMPLPLNEKVKREIASLFNSKRGGGYVGKFTMTSQEKEDEVVVNLVLVENKDFLDMSKPIWERVWAYITTLDVKEKDRATVDRLYGKRWRIETGHRTKNGFLINTTSKRHVVRLFLYLFAQAMRNLWILYDLMARARDRLGWEGTTDSSILRRMSGTELRVSLLLALLEADPSPGGSM